MPIAALWERREGESAKAFALFCAYRDMALPRSLERVGEMSGRSRGYTRVIEGWSSRHCWVERVRAYDSHLDSQRIKAREKAERRTALKEHLDRSRAIASELQRVGMAAMRLAGRSIEAYSNLPPESVQPSEAASLLRVGTSASQVGLDSEAHALGVESAIISISRDAEEPDA